MAREISCPFKISSANLSESASGEKKSEIMKIPKELVEIVLAALQDWPKTIRLCMMISTAVITLAVLRHLPLG